MWPGPSDQLMPILSMIPSAYLDHVIVLATKKFIGKSLDDPKVARNRCIERLNCWLVDLGLFYPSIYQSSSIGATVLYPFLALKFTIAELGTHLRSLHPADAATIVLHNWIKPSILEVPDPELSESDITDSDVPSVTSNTTPDTVRDLPLQPPPTVHSRHGSKTEDPFHTYGLRYTVSRSPDRSRTHRATLEERQEIFDTIASTLHDRCKPDQNDFYPSRGGAWFHLFTLLSENKIDYAGWLSDLFQVLKHHKSPVWTYYLFAKLTRANVRIPYPVAVDIMRYFIDIEKTQWALDVFNRSQSHQWLSSVPELLFALTDSRAVRSQAVFDLLKRPDYANSLPTELRSVANNPLSHERIQLVHHVAYAMAKSPLLTSRMAFRKVCDCLNYLQDRGAPLSSLMSRALVYAGVTRPLREGIWLSTEKFQWILMFVRRLEGDEVADSLDEAAFTLRSENLELDKARMKPLDEMQQEADHIAWEYRKRFGHGSHQSENITSPYKTVTPKRTRVQRRLEFAATVSQKESK
ncbi:unnamed protein product [Aureobasidium vineae]|uniref:Uncharacterized protein n=1 Tax=Aureobasidium vineae TaxID=2773715 RepID=A0A9N8JBM8_9PEZI|nr:unnamed protein product [Aureobasidium vineae]